MRNESAFTDFVETHGNGLARFARLLSANAQDGEDLLQVALLRVHQHWASASISPVAYSKTTLVNLAKDGYRRKGRVPIPLDDMDTIVGASAPDIAIAIAAQSRIDQLLAELPPRQRVTVVLRVLDGLSTEETASLMACSTGTVKSNLARGLERLRDCMTSATPVTQEVSS